MPGQHPHKLKDFILSKIASWDDLRRDAKEKPSSSPIFGVDWMEALGWDAGTEPTRDVRALVQLAESRGITSAQLKSVWTWERFPLSIRQAGLASQMRVASPCGQAAITGAHHPELVEDLDAWILKNEAYLRLLSKRFEEPAQEPWTFGLVQIGQLHGVLSQPYDLSKKRLLVFRPQPLSGFCVLGDRRRDKVFTQPSQTAFDFNWSQMTGDVLKNLDWSNVFIAGGSVLGTLITPDCDEKEVHQKQDWLESDIDLYIWGLRIQDANRKVEHIAQIYQQNLPPGAPFIATRNSQTITLYSSWPTKRVQIVLKLVKNPRDVLLNFDLDPCAVGYDGSNVWMLPRFVRALETGYTNFTMDLIRGHHLGDRKATRDKRLFKYADKGFGLRITDHYLSTCGGLETASELLRSVAEESRLWTLRCLEYYQSLSFFSRGEASDEGPQTLELAYSQLHMNTTTPPTGCLCSFAWLIRYVTLWEQEVLGKVRIRDDAYRKAQEQERGVSTHYDGDSPYSWDRDFNIPHFREHIKNYNSRLTTGVEETVEYLFFHLRASSEFQATRVSYSSSVTSLLSGENDLEIPFVAQKDIVDFANGTLLEAMLDYGIRLSEAPLRIVYQDNSWLSRHLCLVVWRMDINLNWQVLDRRIDEVREVLWEFYRRLVNREVGDWELTEYQEREAKSLTEKEGFLEWLEATPHTLRQYIKPPTPSPIVTQLPTAKRRSKSPFVPKRQTPSPVQDAEDAADDMDVNQAVNELVEETLSGDEEDEKCMDVDEELLSLLDDKPASSASGARRSTPQSSNKVVSQCTAPEVASDASKSLAGSKRA
ncbi:hypothetical protein PQX77_004314 [Marasmius sp. AFHP31]|nr:hypothetical protein PQX77_004314 [Marasmius sp. AFHP31]